MCEARNGAAITVKNEPAAPSSLAGHFRTVRSLLRFAVHQRTSKGRGSSGVLSRRLFFLKVFHGRHLHADSRSVRFVTDVRRKLLAPKRYGSSFSRSFVYMAISSSANTRRALIHQTAASEHEAAAHHHREAAHHHDQGEHDEAKVHASSAQSHSQDAERHTKTAHQHSRKVDQAHQAAKRPAMSKRPSASVPGAFPSKA